MNILIKFFILLLCLTNSLYGQLENHSKISKLGKVTDLPWADAKKLENNIFDFDEIKGDDKVYKYREDITIMQGIGVLEMQMKIANIFYYYADSIFYKYYTNDEAYRRKVTNGVYNKETSELIKLFQENFMEDIFVGDKNKYFGYGDFDEENRDRLQKIFEDLRIKLTNERRKNRLLR